MSTEIAETPLPAVLQQARTEAVTSHLPYAGGVMPQVAWALFSQGLAQLVDVRTTEERHFVGHVPATLHVPWATGTALSRNPRFVRELEAKLTPHGGKDAIVLLLCRSGKRSALAAQAAAKAGFTQVFNVFEGFEGEADARGQRGHGDGWRFYGLPWLQD
jgi:rhodanese-related sulfurtransferase